MLKYFVLFSGRCNTDAWYTQTCLIDLAANPDLREFVLTALFRFTKRDLLLLFQQRRYVVLTEIRRASTKQRPRQDSAFKACLRRQGLNGLHAFWGLSSASPPRIPYIRMHDLVPGTYESKHEGIRPILTGNTFESNQYLIQSRSIIIIINNIEFIRFD